MTSLRDERVSVSLHPAEAVLLCGVVLSAREGDLSPDDELWEQPEALSACVALVRGLARYAADRGLSAPVVVSEVLDQMSVLTASIDQDRAEAEAREDS